MQKLSYVWGTGQYQITDNHLKVFHPNDLRKLLAERNEASDNETNYDVKKNVCHRNT